MPVVPVQRYQALRTAIASYAADPPDVLTKIKVEVRLSRASSEYTPTFVQSAGGWVCGNESKPWSAGDGGADLADRVIAEIGRALDGLNVGRVPVRLHFFGPDGGRVHSNVTDYVEAFAEDGDGMSDDRDRTSLSFVELAKREGMTPGMVATAGDRDGTKMVPTLIVGLMEMTDKVMRWSGDMLDRVMTQNEDLTMRLGEANARGLDLHKVLITAQGEADAERRARAIQSEDDAVKRSMIAMFGRQLGRGIDLAMVKFAGIAPDDPQMKAMFLKGMLNQNPDLIGELGIALEEGNVDPTVLLPALERWTAANPDKAMEFGEKLLAKIAEQAEIKQLAGKSS